MLNLKISISYHSFCLGYLKQGFRPTFTNHLLGPNFYLWDLEAQTCLKASLGIPAPYTIDLVQFVSGIFLLWLKQTLKNFQKIIKIFVQKFPVTFGPLTFLSLVRFTSNHFLLVHCSIPNRYEPVCKFLGQNILKLSTCRKDLEKFPKTSKIQKPFENLKSTFLLQLSSNFPKTVTGTYVTTPYHKKNQTPNYIPSSGLIRYVIWF